MRHPCYRSTLTAKYICSNYNWTPNWKKRNVVHLTGHDRVSVNGRSSRTPHSATQQRLAMLQSAGRKLKSRSGNTGPPSRCLDLLMDATVASGAARLHFVIASSRGHSLQTVDAQRRTICAT